MKRGSIDLLPLAFQDVDVLGPGAAQVLPVDHARFVEDLGEPHLDGRPARAADAQLGPAGEVLPHIEDENARLGEDIVQRNDRVRDLDGRHHLGGQHPLGTVHGLSGNPAGLIVARLVPAGSFQPGVVGFAVIDAVGDDGTVLRLPGSIAYDLDLLPSLEFDVELKKEGQALEPTLPEHHADGVRPFLEVPGHIIGDI